MNGVAPGATPTEIFKKALGIETDSVKNASDLLLDKAKDALDKWRKKKQ